MRLNCSSYIDDFIIILTSPLLEDNVDHLENAYLALTKALRKIGLQIELSKTKLMHFAAKNIHTKRSRKPLQFQIPFSHLPNVELHPIIKNTSTVIIPPSKEWRYLGFYFDPFLSFSSHVQRYSNKASKIIQNLRILGHLCDGLHPKLCKQVYLAVVWSVMAYGLPLWYHKDGKGCQALLKKIQTVQNESARWISGAFCTSPTAHLEYITGLPPLRERANVLVHSFTLRISKVPPKHPLRLISEWPNFHPLAPTLSSHKRPVSESIWLLQSVISNIPASILVHPICRIGS